MATVTDTPTTQPPPPELTADEMAVKVDKRYEGLVMVRTKAIKGKGAWYWAHLEPILVPNQDSGEPKAVKLRCCLCEAVFSASNPSRTASEHLKRGTCPNFNPGSSPDPISSVSPAGLSSPESQPHRKRKSSGDRRGGGFKVNNSETTYSVAPITMIEPPRFSVDVSCPARASIFGSGGVEEAEVRQRRHGRGGGGVAVGGESGSGGVKDETTAWLSEESGSGGCGGWTRWRGIE